MNQNTENKEQYREEFRPCPCCGNPRRYQYIDVKCSVHWEAWKQGQKWLYNSDVEPPKYKILEEPYWEALPCEHCAAIVSRRQAQMMDTGIPKGYQGKTIKQYIPYDKKQEKMLRDIHKLSVISVFCGATGTGKTHIGCALVSERAESRKTAHYVCFDDVLLKIRSTYSKTVQQTEDEILKNLCAYNLLVIDEVGSEKPSEFSNRMLFGILDTRLKSDKQTILIGNLSMDGFMRHIKDVDKLKKNERIFSRVFQTKNSFVHFAWEDFRTRGIAI